MSDQSIILQLSASLLQLYQILPSLLRKTEALTSELDKHSRVIIQRLERNNRDGDGETTH